MFLFTRIQLRSKNIVYESECLLVEEREDASYKINVMLMHYWCEGAEKT